MAFIFIFMLSYRSSEHRNRYIFKGRTNHFTFCLPLTSFIKTAEIKICSFISANIYWMPTMFLPWRGNGNSLQYSCLENPQTMEPDRLQSIESQSQTPLNWLSTPITYVKCYAKSEASFPNTFVLISSVVLGVCFFCFVLFSRKLHVWHFWILACP